MNKEIREKLDRIACYNEPSQIDLSFCPFNNGSMDIIVINKDTGEEVTIEIDKHNLSEKQLNFLDKVAPACVWTTYERKVY